MISHANDTRLRQVTVNTELLENSSRKVWFGLSSCAHFRLNKSGPTGLKWIPNHYKQPWYHRDSNPKPAVPGARALATRPLRPLIKKGESSATILYCTLITEPNTYLSNTNTCVILYTAILWGFLNSPEAIQGEHCFEDLEFGDYLSSRAIKSTRRVETNPQACFPSCGKRDFGDYGDSVEPVEGVVLVDSDYLKDRKVFGQVVTTFRYGREEDEVMGLQFSRQLYLALDQIYPSDQQLEKSELQDKLLRKLGESAIPFTFDLPENAPPSVTLQPGTDDQGSPLGVEYELKLLSPKTRKRNPTEGTRFPWQSESCSTSSQDLLQDSRVPWSARDSF
ncbi:arrestin, lateral eye [Caerostris extrusa]|uniref:Arrestin, lateral eye n=1 Tax=Caerostris extrusa TaxID=172846 RepID=A0AAV4W2Y1_CAEEX|nr:arrestin, lateral eye [Caerostris extrusa]